MDKTVIFKITVDRFIEEFFFYRLPKMIYLHYLSSAELDFLWHLFCLSKNPVLSALSFRAYIGKAHRILAVLYSTWNKGSWDTLEVWWLLKNEIFPSGFFFHFPPMTFHKLVFSNDYRRCLEGRCDFLNLKIQTFPDRKETKPKHSS